MSPGHPASAPRRRVYTPLCLCVVLCLALLLALALAPTGQAARRKPAPRGPFPMSVTFDVRLGGRAIAPDGAWSAPAELPRVANERGVISVRIRPTSAALLTVAAKSAG